jgi:transcriptional antiterminator Rof (Rho-off)
MKGYQPVACAFHDVFEIAILRGQGLWARWETPEGEARAGRLAPLDLRVRDRAEWLLAEDETGAHLELRLDWFSSVQPADSSDGGSDAAKPRR